MKINRLQRDSAQNVLRRLATALLGGLVLTMTLAWQAPVVAQTSRALKSLGDFDAGLGSGQGASGLGASGLGTSGLGDTVFPNVNFGGLADAQQEPVTWTAEYRAKEGVGVLEIEAVVGRSWHVYSTTQPSGGPLPTRFSITSPESVSITGEFTPSELPQKSVSEAYPGVTIEEHTGVVRWSAPIKLNSDFQGDVTVDVKALTCKTGGGCLPSNETLVAKFAGPPQIDSSADASRSVMPGVNANETLRTLSAEFAANPTTFRDDDYQVTWTAGLSLSIAPGKTGQLVFTAKPETSYHVYHGVVDDAESATNFVITQKAGLLVGAPETDQPVISKNLFPSIPGVPDVPPVKYHEGDVSWVLPIHVPDDASPGEYEINGFVCYQACTVKSCLQPKAMKFSATVMVTDQTDQTLQPIQIETSRFSSAIKLAATTNWVDVIRVDITEPGASPDTSEPRLKMGSAIEAQLARDKRQQQRRDAIAAAQSNGANPKSENPDDAKRPALAAEGALTGSESAASAPGPALPLILLMAFGGGVILNLMPCVLPVVGLKVMSFVQQAGEDRKRIFALNFAYVAGILAVFAGLTFLAVFASFGWGQQFTYFPVRLGLTVLIFALALSYLGVWELPTPGMATSEASQELQSREGLGGAFFKGAFATILATPCSGPLLGVVLGYTISLHPVQTALVMMTVGVGMAMPYILLGLFPSAISFVPKPGDWMVTLKEFMAFLFLGTVAFFFNQFSDAHKLPVFVTLIGVWFGCWAIGKVPPWESLQKRARGWGIGVVSAAAIGWFAFAYLAKNPPAQGDPSLGGVEYIVDNHLRWEKYDETRLKELQAAGKTVMLDFTAAWCTNCFVNKKVALDTEPTQELLEELGGVAMLADWTDQNEEIESKLNELQSKSIPVLAIFPGNKPEKPIVLRDLVSQNAVLEALKEAGPSTTSGQASSLTSANAKEAAQSF